MPYSTKNFEHLLGLEGLSNQLLKNHFALYEGYVKNTNKLLEEKTTLLEAGQTNTPAFAELTRRFGWEWNGMRLHELYFGNLKKDGEELPDISPLRAELEKNFGDFENWKKDFLALGSMRGIGWVILARDSETKNLFNIWINEHDTGHLAGAVPLLVMDVFEHAFMIDYGLKKIDYLEVFMKNIDWGVVENRSRGN
ncbi:MAG: Superoxide dismutase, Fe-Mn family [Candidatus Uhrbacteria bacterium GW2011_GWE2_45_35]|uniref:superoxide dismutase n=2 Tax=Candidatus Uhriibacteriota TaxID=1752732 RepID=A0A0G1JG85_9BACT|nr:MAG: Superoxide dismutase, Fe-Mn family [Candidatus Uhrbacteria bacterium GW2011_GWF2_44_350]KKU07723.1 MAG: Superoxide dismutase, Fe-Mn family [Candidatus Uhrbacteria bacterium GW2011_GWE2_45_35]HBR80991.1 superoxide dismutase [Candidatus Uhrbacteria bacterium]HCU31393.1 superoxide dismutase [Candidatus Uhrbacteria bacterium]